MRKRFEIWRELSIHQTIDVYSQALIDDFVLHFRGNFGLYFMPDHNHQIMCKQECKNKRRMRAHLQRICGIGIELEEK